VRHLGNQPGAAPAPPVMAGHVGLGSGLVDEDEAVRVKPALVFLPLRAPPSDVGAVLFAGEQAFLKSILSGLNNRHTEP